MAGKQFNQKKSLNTELEQQYELTENNGTLKKELESDRMKIFLLKKELFDQLEREEKLLLELKKIRRQYDALRSSKLGKITVKYWMWKNRRR